MKTFILIIVFLLSFTNIGNSKTILGKARIIDGDTIHIKSNKIRLHGIDAPETKQICKIDNEDWYVKLLKRIYNMKKRYGSLIDGSWVKHKKTFDVINPFDNSKDKWKNLHQYVVTQKISDISDAQYSDMFI